MGWFDAQTVAFGAGDSAEFNILSPDAVGKRAPMHRPLRPSQRSINDDKSLSVWSDRIKLGSTPHRMSCIRPSFCCRWKVSGFAMWISSRERWWIIPFWAKQHPPCCKKVHFVVTVSCLKSSIISNSSVLLNQILIDSVAMLQFTELLRWKDS